MIAEQLAEKFRKSAQPLELGVITDEYCKGYVVGINALEQQTGAHRIRTEKILRGNSNPDPQFEEWKQGYFVGLFQRLEIDLQLSMGEM